MNKNELQDGMVVKTRNGIYFLSLGNVFIGKRISIGKNEYNDELEDLYLKGKGDIVLVYKLNYKNLMPGFKLDDLLEEEFLDYCAREKIAEVIEC